MGALTLSDILAVEPRLRELLAAAAVADDGAAWFCPNVLWGVPGGFKARLQQLVGWDAPHAVPVLRTADAYEIAAKALLAALPPCRNCGCT